MDSGVAQLRLDMSEYRARLEARLPEPVARVAL